MHLYHSFSPLPSLLLSLSSSSHLFLSLSVCTTHNSLCPISNLLLFVDSSQISFYCFVLLPWPLTFTKLRWWSFFLMLVEVNGRWQETMLFNFLKCVWVMDAFLKRLIIYLLNYNNKQEVESFRRRQRPWERRQRRTQMSWKRNQFVSGSGSGGIQVALLPPTMTTIISSKGLSNEPGQNSCFLNSALQVHTRLHTRYTHWPYIKPQPKQHTNTATKLKLLNWIQVVQLGERSGGESTTLGSWYMRTAE